MTKHHIHRNSIITLSYSLSRFIGECTQRIAMGLRPVHSSCPESHVIVVIWTIKNVVFILHVPWPKVRSSRTWWSSDKIWSQTSRKKPSTTVNWLVTVESDAISLCLSFLLCLSKPEHFRVKEFIIWTRTFQSEKDATDINARTTGRYQDSPLANRDMKSL